jgi:hypothetical protein
MVKALHRAGIEVIGTVRDPVVTSEGIRLYQAAEKMAAYPCGVDQCC